MNEVYRRKPAPPDWPRPEGIVVRQIDPASGLLAGPACPASVSEYFIAGTDPTQTCIPQGYNPTDPNAVIPPPTSNIDTSFGFSRPGAAPIPRATGTPPSQSAPVDSAFLPGRPAPAFPPTIVVPGSAPITRMPRPARHDSTRRLRDSATTRDTSNPFVVPKA